MGFVLTYFTSILGVQVCHKRKIIARFICHRIYVNVYLAQRLLSIMEQASFIKEERHVFGRLYPLIDMPSDSDLDAILDGASRVLRSRNRGDHEHRMIFDKWFKRRLECSRAITPKQLSSWLRNIWNTHDAKDDKTVAALKARFEREPLLFEGVYELLASTLPNEKNPFWYFIAHDLWELLPPKVWPVPQSNFFIERVKKAKYPEHAADLFRMFLSCFPAEGGSVALVEEGLALLEHRKDIVKVLGNWKSCKIQKWQKDQWKRSEQEGKKYSKIHAQNITFLQPRLTTIQEGKEEQALVWAVQVYTGLFYDVVKIPDARERLVSVTNDEIADALVQGFVRYAENPDIPRKETIIESWQANSISYTHVLLSLSVFLRLKAGMTVPDESLPHCLAAVFTEFDSVGNIPDYRTTLTAWFLKEVAHNSSVIKSVLKEIWISSVKNKRGNLPGFYELIKDSESQPFLASLSAEVLQTAVNEDTEAVGKLVSVLLHYDQRAALAIGESELSRSEMSQGVKVIWVTALFVVDPNKYLTTWKSIMMAVETPLWGAMGIIRGDRHENMKALHLTATQRAEVISTIGRRFANIECPASWTGNRNPWDASEFVANQIKLLVTDGSTDAGTQLGRLENDLGLASYHDLIRHHRAQHEKLQRESSFTFALPEQVAKAIRNCEPATPNDLLAFVVNHLESIAYELTRTQRERYRAYWNERERNLSEPKREEVCSGLLTEDLQNRVRAQNLIVTVEHHMVADKECDLVVLQGTERLLPIEVKHHYHRELWTAWRTQLDLLYSRDAKAGGLGIYLVLWSGEAKGRRMPKLPKSIIRPTSAAELKSAIESLIPEVDQHRLRVIVVDISGPSTS